MGTTSKMINDHVTSGYVTAAGAEALGKRAHHDVNVGGVHAPILAYSASAFAHATDAVRLVQINVSLDGDIEDK